MSCIIWTIYCLLLLFTPVVPPPLILFFGDQPTLSDQSNRWSTLAPPLERYNGNLRLQSDTRHSTPETLQKDKGERRDIELNRIQMGMTQYQLNLCNLVADTSVKSKLMLEFTPSFLCSDHCSSVGSDVQMLIVIRSHARVSWAVTRGLRDVRQGTLLN